MVIIVTVCISFCNSILNIKSFRLVVIFVHIVCIIYFWIIKFMFKEQERNVILSNTFMAINPIVIQLPLT